jgi:predicted nuclease of restriction endonuclease-like (RecB) superfamily
MNDKKKPKSAEQRKSRGVVKPNVIMPVPSNLSEMPEGYAEFLSGLKERITQERIKAVMSANAALVLMYWDMGSSILERQQNEGWGAKVVDRLSHDLKSAFPDMSGFSPRNLKYMRAFAAAWPSRELVQRTVAQLPWRSNLTLLEKLEDPELRLWYAQKAIENGMGKDMLTIQIETRLHERQGKAITNFPAALPPAESDMIAQVFKDPYVFDFLGTADPRREAELELKAGKFEPGYVSQLNFYLNVVDDLLRHADDKPSIGLLLVKDKNQTVVEYALAGYTKPIGVAQWERQITKTLPEDLKSSLPSVDEIEAELAETERV